MRTKNTLTTPGNAIRDLVLTWATFLLTSGEKSQNFWTHLEGYMVIYAIENIDRVVNLSET